MATRTSSQKSNSKKRNFAVISLPGEDGIKLRKSLDEFAKSNDRTISNQVRLILRDRLIEEGYLK